ncbi:MAG: TrmH family RNA methyltransferase [Pseudonocardia sp.]|jgi:RNA methyltransferase, TrmH family
MAAQQTITSAANPVVKRVRALADRRARRREGAFVVAGVQPVRCAVEAGWELETLLVVPDRLPESAAGMVADRRAAGTAVVELAESLAARLSERDTPPGLLAVVRCRDAAVPEAVGPEDVFVALDRVANPGNLGTVLRTADAAEAAGVILLGDTADQYAPAAVKASMGSLFAVPVCRMPDAEALFGWAGAVGASVVATSGYAERAHWAGTYRTPTVLLLGNEGEGLPAEVLARADHTVRIPMGGTAESLNLAVAAALMLYEVRRPVAGG